MAAFQGQPASCFWADRNAPQRCRALTPSVPKHTGRRIFCLKLVPCLSYPHRGEGLLKHVGQPNEQERDGAEVSNNSKCTISPPCRPFSWVCLLLPGDGWTLQTCLPPVSTTLQLHIQDEGAETAQLEVSSGAVASAQAELITCFRLWDLCHSWWTSHDFQRAVPEFAFSYSTLLL